MLTVKGSLKYEESIKKSKFLTFIFQINTKQEAELILEKYRALYKDATHIVYAYVIEENTFKYSDDGEPTNSAGIPIYSILNKKNLDHILCIVVRYFGGIKLGVGGLTHAYTSGVKALLSDANNIEEYIVRSPYLIEIEHSLFDSVSYYLNKKGIAIYDKQFLTNIIIEVSLSDNDLSDLKDKFPTLSITQANL